MIARITIFDLVTGEIKRRISCQDIDVQLQISDGEGYINGDVDDEKYIIVNGTRVEKPPLPPPTVAPLTLKDFESAADKLIDDTVRAKGYKSIESCTKYIGFPNRWQAECQALLSWNVDIWDAAHSILNAVNAGTQAPPATTKEFLAMLPAAP